MYGPGAGLRADDWTWRHNKQLAIWLSVRGVINGSAGPQEGRQLFRNERRVKCDLHHNEIIRVREFLTWLCENLFAQFNPQ